MNAVHISVADSGRLKVSLDTDAKLFPASAQVRVKPEPWVLPAKLKQQGVDLARSAIIRVIVGSGNGGWGG